MHKLAAILKGNLTRLLAVSLITLLLPFRAESKPLDTARESFKAQNYDQAISSYTEYLRNAPSDANVWNELAAAYYHAGLPRRALRYLKSVEKKTHNISYNAYYQGLCMQDLQEKPSDIAAAFAKAAEHSDEYGARALFELAAAAYNARQAQQASAFVHQYLQRFPKGVYATIANSMAESLRYGRWIESPIRGRNQIDREAALYRYNSLSLTSKPHFWMTQIGGTGILRTGKDPNDKGGLVTRQDSNQAIIANATFGLGPFNTPATTSWVGYSYEQLWLTDADRLNTYQDDMTDFEYQPYQLDLLRRDHSLFADFRRSMPGNTLAGTYGKITFSRIGSRFSFRAPDKDLGLERVMAVSDSTIFIPWIGASYLENFRSLLYLYFRKQINTDSQETSNKTYEFGTSRDNAISFGLSHSMTFPSIDLEVEIEAFKYRFIFNDPWFDYDRLGGALVLENQFLPGFYLTFAGGIYNDTYILPIIRAKGCKTIAGDISTSAGSDASTSPTSCPRDDSGWLAEIGAYWNLTQFHRVTFSYSAAQSSNAEQQEFDESKQEFVATLSIAFPSVKRVTRFAQRFADLAFTKDAQ